MIEISPATTKSQFQLIEKLAKSIWYEHYPSIISNEQIAYMLDKFNSVKGFEESLTAGVLFFCISNNGEPVGYVSIKNEVDYLFINKLYLLKTYRGKGIAKKTMMFIEDKANDFNLPSIKLYVNKYNKNSILAYEKMGFVKIKAIITDIGNGFVMDDFEMEKQI